jgi:DNA (cytosine-5)-methyltransferase 1
MLLITVLIVRLYDEGLTFQVILESLEELGYWSEWQVLNSKHFGVPQNRQRVFIIGHLAGAGGREVFPILEDGEDIDRERAVVGALQGGAHSGGLHSQVTAIATLTPDRAEQRQHGRRFKEDGEPMFTLTGQDVHGVMIADFNQDGNIYFKNHSASLRTPRATQSNLLLDKRIRRLTPVECERLQGFPDNWTAGVSDTQRYKCLGNAVTVNVIEFLGRRLMERAWSARE